MSAPIDRVNGRSSPSQDAWSGRWQYEGRYLLDTNSHTGSPRDDISSEHLATFESIVEDIRVTANDASWRTLLELSVLDRVSEDDAHPGSDELLLQTHMSSIEIICNKEYLTRIGEISEVIPVSRVRRPARRALDRLAGHTEDWAGRNLSGPVPRRALAVLRDENVDLYENRMVTELVHPILTSALMRRLRRLRRMQANLAELVNHPEGTTFRIGRLYRFWGVDAGRARQSSEQVAGTIRFLDGLLRQVQKLRGSKLSLLIGGRTSGTRSLRKTNVIQDHRHYRAAGLIWTAFQTSPETVESQDERRIRYQERHGLFATYVLAFVVQALDDLSYRPESDSVPMSGAESQEVALQGPWGQCTLATDVSGVITLNCLGVRTRFVPLLDLITESDSAEDVKSRWHSVSQVVDGPTVVVYLGSPMLVKNLSVGLASSLISAGKDLQGPQSDVTAVPISPLEISSLERVSRAVASAIQIPILKAYPIPIESQDKTIPRRLIESLEDAAIQQPGLSPLFYKPSSESIALRRPFTELEESRLESFLDARVKATSTMSWEKDFAVQISTLRQALDDAHDRVKRLLECPVCRKEATTGEVKREDDVFLVACRSCPTRWGHEKCGKCAGRICIIEPGDKIINPDVSGPGWVERILGRDALASPCWSRVSPLRYICNECRECNGADAGLASDCPRCRLED